MELGAWRSRRIDYLSMCTGVSSVVVVVLLPRFGADLGKLWGCDKGGRDLFCRVESGSFVRSFGFDAPPYEIELW